MEYKLGQDILPDEEPFSHIIFYQFRAKFCDWCIRNPDDPAQDDEEELKKCSGCKEFYYCNRDCQRKAFAAYHKEECSKLKTIPSEIDLVIRDVLIFMKRTIIRVQNGAEKALKLPNGIERRFEDLMAHESKYSLRTKINTKMTLKEIFNSSWCQNWFGCVAFEYLLKVYGKLQINQTNIFGYSMSGSVAIIGYGLYIGASSLDHSCAPNAVYVIKNGKTIQVRAIEDIESFSDVRINYIVGCHETSKVRQKFLKDSYHFDCDCQLCEDKESDGLKSSVMCPKHERADWKNETNDPYLHCVPIKTGKCIKCGTPISDDIISKYRSLKAEIEIIADSPDFDYANWYKEAVAIFHPYDSTYYAFAKKCTTSIKIKDHRGQEQRKEIFRKLNIVMITYIERHFGNYDPPTAEVYFNCGKNFFYKKIGNLELCSKFLLKAMAVLEVSHGIHHPQYELVRQTYLFCFEGKVIDQSQILAEDVNFLMRNCMFDFQN